MKRKMLETIAGPSGVYAQGKVYNFDDNAELDATILKYSEVYEKPKPKEYKTTEAPKENYETTAGPKLDEMTKVEIIEYAQSEGIPLQSTQRQAKKSVLIAHIESVLNG